MDKLDKSKQNLALQMDELATLLSEAKLKELGIVRALEEINSSSDGSRPSGQSDGGTSVVGTSSNTIRELNENVPKNKTADSQ